MESRAERVSEETTMMETLRHTMVQQLEDMKVRLEEQTSDSLQKSLQVEISIELTSP